MQVVKGKKETLYKRDPTGDRPTKAQDSRLT